MTTDFYEHFKNYVYEPIDLCAIYEPLFEPPAEQVEEWCRMRETEPQDPFSCTVTCKIGNTWYIVETECDGDERLPNMVSRIIFSGQEAV